MKKTPTIMRIGGLSAVAALALSACGGDTDNGGDDTDGSGPADTLTVAIAGEEPYSYLDDSGEPTGAAYALSQEILGDQMGYDVENEQTDWDSLIPGLGTQQWDVVAAGMSITPERCAEAAFSEPEIMYTTAFLVDEGNPYDVHSFEDLAAAQESDDISVVTLTAGVEAGYAEDTGVTAEGVSSAEDGVDFVAGGRADVFALTGISLNAMAGDMEGVEVTESFAHEVSAGSTVFRLEDTELLAQYNENLAELKESGELLEIISEYGFTEAEIPPADLTAEQLCEGNIEELDAEFLDD